MRHILISLFLLLLCACTQDSPPTAIGISSVDWPNYANDPGASKYADLEQINRDTVAQLEIAWVLPTRFCGRWMPQPVSASGTIRSFITSYGITIHRRHRIW